VLYWRGREIEWVHQPIIAHPPPSWGASSYRYRPKFLCPVCERGCYHLHPVGEALACRVCASVPCPSRADGRQQEPGLFRRMAKLRLALGVRDPSILADLPPPPRGPRSRWLYYRRAAALRLIELRLLGEPLEDYLARAEPPPPPPGRAQGRPSGP
jgi:hypothetical protein